jgi:8-oxo-dGTP pyrophosphatase MutT (NUDIX family)
MAAGAQDACVQSPTHAGALVVRPGRGGTDYLIVRARSEWPEWVLPKGHIEPGESVEQAALREVREEAGIEAEIVAPIGTTEFRNQGEPTRVVYYLARCLRAVPAAERREVRWCGYHDAQRLLTFEDTKEILSAGRAALPTFLTAGKDFRT